MGRAALPARIALACIGLLVGCGRHSEHPEMKHCLASGTTPESRVQACSAVIRDENDEHGRFARVGRAHAFAELKRFAEAEADYAAALGVRPDPFVFAFRSALRRSSGDMEGAWSDVNEALRLDPGNAFALLARAELLGARGEWLKVIGDYTIVMKTATDPELKSLARGGRCWARAVAELDLDAGLADCDRRLREAPDDANSYNSRGFLHFRAGRHADAISDYSRAIELDPSVASSYYVRGLAHGQLGDANAADADLQAALAREPGVVERYRGYGVREITQGAETKP